MADVLILLSVMLFLKWAACLLLCAALIIGEINQNSMDHKTQEGIHATHKRRNI